MRIQWKEHVRHRGIQVKHKPVYFLKKSLKSWGRMFGFLFYEVKRPEEMGTIDLW